MKNMNSIERRKVVGDKSKELMGYVINLQQGKDVNLNHVMSLVYDIYRDELDLISIAEHQEMKHNNRYDDPVEIPSFIYR